MIIFFSDLHCKEKEPHRSACLSILDSLYNNHKDDVVICGGDLFNQSSHHHNLVDEVINRIVKFKDFRIITGNHDSSARLGNLLKPLRHHKNITIYENKTFFEIDGISFLALPSQSFHEKQYEEITETVDYTLNHFTPVQEAFAGEGIELKNKVNVAHIFGHIHRYKEFNDNFENKVLIAGSILSTRYGEQDWEKNYYILHKDHYDKISVEQTFTYEAIEYGQFPENKNNILNIKNAPSISSVYDTYKDYYIRQEGIELLRTEQEVDAMITESFELSDIKNRFNIWAKEKMINKEIVDCANKYLNVVKT